MYTKMGRFSIDKSKRDKTFVKMRILVLISLIIFFARNINRINNEIVKYDYKPFKDPYLNVESNFFLINDKINLLINNYINCQKSNSCSEVSEKKVKKIYGKFYFENMK